MKIIHLISLLVCLSFFTNPLIILLSYGVFLGGGGWMGSVGLEKVHGASKYVSSVASVHAFRYGAKRQKCRGKKLYQDKPIVLTLQLIPIK